MKFKISRTSIWDDKKPCDGAIQEEYNRFDSRTLGSFQEYDDKYGHAGTWLSKGVNHCINKKGYIQRELKDKGWFIELNTLDELVDFQKKYGSIIIDKYYMNPDILEIEIYDDYRE